MNQVDLDKDGVINFPEFLRVMKGPSGKGSDTQENAFFKAYKNSSIKFFEEAAAKTVDKTDANREQIKKEYEERKRLAAIKKAALEQEEAERKAAEEKKNASRQALADKAKMFEGK